MPKPVRKKSRFKRILMWMGIFTLFGILGGASFVAMIVRDLPSPEKLAERKVIESTKIYDRTGTVLLYEIHGSEKRTVVPFDRIPQTVKNATIALEDANFYNHHGIDIRGIARAFIVDLFSRNLSQGGSTITQQLIKNSLLGRERTISRKVKEAILSLLLESKYSKDEILNLYLNQIPYGASAYGIEAATETYFGTSTEHISLAESALLASLARAPTYYSPYGSHVKELTTRKNFALDRMALLGYITKQEAEKAKTEKIEFLPQSKEGIRAPHFVMYVRDMLNQKYGEQYVEEGGLTVRTTLDWRLQEEAEKIVKAGAEFNEKAIKAKNAALVAIDPRNGEMLAMVGSRDYFDIEHEGNFNVATALRQPGSSFKPFAYATAFKKGFLPTTVLFDVATEFNPLCSPEGIPQSPHIKKDDCYNPQDYDERFRGPVTLRQSIAQSLNVPSVKLLYLAGINDVIATAESLGITSLKDKSRFGLSLVLGGAEVRLTEMVSAYGVFATNGVLSPPAAILRVESKNSTLEEKHDQPTQVLDTEVAETINDVLSDDDARIPVFQPHGSLWLPDRPVAAKTGTTQEYRDAWAIGYTPSLVVGVWAGNNDNAPMQQKGSGVLAAAPIWNKFMKFATKDTLPEFFSKPEYKKSPKPVLNGLWQGEVVVRTDKISGKVATDLTPEELIQETAYGTPHDPLFWIKKDDILGAPFEDPFKDPQYKNWDAALQKWLKLSGFTPKPISSAPTITDDIHTTETKPQITIETVTDNGKTYSVIISVLSKNQLNEVNATASDSLIASGQNLSDGKMSLTISKDALGTLPATITIKAYDQIGNWGEASLTLPPL